MTSVPIRDAASAGDQTELAAAVVEARLRAGHPTELRVGGRSMEPFLAAGQRVLLEPCPDDALKRGDVAAFVRDGRLILHRIVAVDADAGMATLKGDNAAAAEVVATAEIMGRATAVLWPRRVSLVEPGRQRIGRWLARFSVVHGQVHRFAHRWPLLGLIPATAATVAMRAIGFLLRPPR